MRIVITGGCGYIGSRIARRLQDIGHEILILDNLSTTVPGDLTDCRVVECDITSQESLERVDGKGCDAMLHLAAQSSGPRSFYIPNRDIEINVLGTLNSINWAITNEIPRFIHASSFVVYGDHPDSERLSETSICNPKSIYGLSKFTSEKLLEIYAEPHGIQWNVLRMFNIFGPGQDLSRDDQGMVSIFYKLVQTRDVIEVKGSLDRFRDFIYIDDVVRGWELCLMNRNSINQVYNLGSGTKTHISTLLNELITVCGKEGKIKVKEVSATQGDVQGAYADIEKISNSLNYRPMTDLNNGLRKFRDWAESIR
jgi:UDP-glucose 4-epimerase